MTQCNALNVKLSNQQLSKLNSGINNEKKTKEKKRQKNYIVLFAENTQQV